MATAADHFVALAKESTYGTAVTPTRAYPFVEGTESDFDVRWRTGKGVTGGNGRRSALGTRMFLPAGKGTLTTVTELETKGLGALLDLALGVSSVAAITGGTQQQFHPGIANLVLPSATIQVGKVRNDGAYLVETYRGCTASKVTIEQPEDNIPTVTVEWDALGVTTATAAITPTYATAPTLLDSSQAQVFYGGALTAPTATTAATVATASGVFRSWKLEIDQKINDDGWILSSTGVRSQPKAGTPEIKLAGTVELQDAALVTNYLTGVRAPLLTTYTTPEVLGAGFAQFQVLIPQLALSKGVPQVKPGEAPTTFDIEGMVSNDGTNRDVVLVYRTSDAAL